MNDAHPSPQCPLDAVLRLLMGPWTTYIIWLLHSRGALRFGQLRSLMPDISAKMLTERLRLLEREKIVHRDYKPSIPPTVTYSLTLRGRDLKGVLEGLDAIAFRWRDEDRSSTANDIHAQEDVVMEIERA